MYYENINFYEVLGINLKDRDPQIVEMGEIEAAYRKIEADYKNHQSEYRNKSKTCHPDAARNSKEAKSLNPDELEKFIEDKTKEFIKATEKWESDTKNFKRAEDAFNGLKDPKTRARHDERFRNTRPRSEGRSDGRSSSDSKGGANGRSQTNHTWGSDFWGFDFSEAANQQEEAFRTELKNFIDAKRKSSVKPDLRDFDLSFRNLSGMDLEGCVIKKPLIHTNFKGANLKNVDFSDQSLWNCVFDETTQLDGANFSKARFSSTVLPKNLKNINFDSVHFFEADSANLSDRVLENCSFNNTRLSFSDIKNTTFKNCSFQDTKFGFSKLKNVVFEGGQFRSAINYAELTNVTFRNLDGELLDLTKGTLQDIKLEGSIKGLKLRKEQLKYVDHTKATVGEFKVVNFFDREIKEPFTKDPSKTQIGNEVERVEQNAENERNFFERMVRNAEGKVHVGKVAAIIAGTAVVGGVIYQLSKPKKPWTEHIEAKSKDEGTTINR